MTTQQKTVPNQLDFAEEIRAERLSVLWKVTLVLIVLAVWGSLILTSMQASGLGGVIFPTLAGVVGCFGCRAFLHAQRYARAVWSYILGLLVAVAFVASSAAPGSGDPRLFFTFVYPLIVLMMGFLLPIRATII